MNFDEATRFARRYPGAVLTRCSGEEEFRQSKNTDFKLVYNGCSLYTSGQCSLVLEGKTQDERHERGGYGYDWNDDEDDGTREEIFAEVWADAEETWENVYDDGTAME